MKNKSKSSVNSSKSKAKDVLRSIQIKAKKDGISKMTLEEINAEISASRKTRRKTI